MSIKKYTWETEEQDIWRFDSFDTIKECIQDCENYCCDCSKEIPKTILIGETRLYSPVVDADVLLEEISEQAYDEVGEVAEGWRPQCANNKEIDELSNRLTEIVNKWLEKNNNKPDFYSIENITEINILEFKE